MLANMDEQEVRRLIGRRPLRRFTARTVTNVDALLADLRATAKRGYAVADQEMGAGIITVGAAIRNHTGTTVAALSIAALAAESRSAVLVHLGDEARRAAAQIATRLGYRRPAEAAV
jgi:DNA-binding IclR family transcriptional regulator